MIQEKDAWKVNQGGIMQSSNLADDFRRELHDRATSKGSSTLPGLSYPTGNGSTSTRQGYTFNQKELWYNLEGTDLTLRVSLQSHAAGLVAAARYAIEPNIPASVHEQQLKTEIHLTWNGQQWQLQADSDGNVLGLPGRKLFDNENLAQCCVNWLCSNN